MARLILILLFCSFPMVQAQTASLPLTSEEQREILIRLYEVQSCREQLGVYKVYVERDKEQDAREKANYERSLVLEKEATALANEKAAFYKDAYEAVTQGRSTGCWIAKIFTLGIARCR